MSKYNDGSCVWCGTIQDLHMHHIIYRSHGGPDTEDNLICLCWRHHAMVHSDPRFMLKILSSLKNTELWRWDAAYEYIVNTYGD